MTTPEQPPRIPGIAPEAAGRAVETIVGEVDRLVAVYLYGSRADGTWRSESDVDLAVLAAGPLEPRRVADLQLALGVTLNTTTQLVDLRAAPTVLAMQIITKGTPVVDRDSARRERFEDLVFCAYARLNEERRGILEDITTRGVVYGG